LLGARVKVFSGISGWPGYVVFLVFLPFTTFLGWGGEMGMEVEMI